MRTPISLKISLLAFFGVVISCGIAVSLTFHLMLPPLEESISSNIRMIKNLSDQSFKDLSENYHDTVRLVATDSALVEAVLQKNSAKTQEIGKATMKETGCDFVTITDDKGYVIARSHSDKKGDSVNSQETVQSALKGESTVGVVQGTVIPFSLRAGAPIRYNGKIIGTIGMGISLTTEKYVDKIKQNSGLEFTVFQGDTRVQTTIRGNDGKRIIGTKTTNQDILTTVLNKGDAYYGETLITDKPYIVAYWPILNVHNKPIGMWFVGNPLEQLNAIKKTATIDVILSSFFIVIIVTGIAFYIGHKIATPVKSINRFAYNIANGKLDSTLDVRSSDETASLATALLQMVDSLKSRIAEANEAMKQSNERQLEAENHAKEAEKAKEAENAKREAMLNAAHNLTEVVEAVKVVSNALSDGIEVSDHGAKEQANIVAETAVSMDEMKSAVNGVAQSASNATNVATEVRKKAQEGVNQVAQVTSSMAELSEASNNISKDMAQLGQQANDIGNILSVISDIADQTNLLALNAAIEAARAGEAGRGFAVVADEVRKLAEKTMSATQEVNHAISSIQASVNTNIANVGKTGEMAQHVSEVVEESGKVLDEILQLAEASADQVRSIAAASEEQSASCEHIGNSVDTINKIATHVVDAMQKSDAAVKGLLEQADRLSKLVDEMKRL